MKQLQAVKQRYIKVMCCFKVSSCILKQSIGYIQDVLSNKPHDRKHKLSHEKNPYYFPLYWLVNRDPYNGL